MAKHKKHTKKKVKEKWYQSRRIWSAISMGVSGISLAFVQAGYLPETFHLTIGQIVVALGGAFGTSISWLKPKK